MDNAKSQLIHAITNCKTLDEFAEMSMKIFGNPMIISDDCLRIHGITNIITDSERYEYLRKYRFLPPELTNITRTERTSDNIWQTHDAEIHDVDGELHLTKILRINDQLIGRIDIVGLYRSFSAEDIEYAELLAPSVSLMLYRLNAIILRKKTDFEYYLEYLLDGNQPSDENLKGRLDQSDWKSRQYLYVICISNFEKDSVDISYSFRFLRNGEVKLRYLNHTVMILSRSKPLIDEQLTEIEQSMTSNELHCGISPAFNDIRALRNSYILACAALDLGIRIHPRRWLYKYQDYTTYNTFRTHNAQDALFSFIPPQFHTLIKIDKEQHLGLLKTLRCYFYNSESISKTAEVLHLHKNTVTYRINRVFDILEHSKDDGHFHMQVCTAIQILEYLDCKYYFD